MMSYYLIDMGSTVPTNNKTITPMEPYLRSIIELYGLIPSKIINHDDLLSEEESDRDCPLRINQKLVEKYELRFPSPPPPDLNPRMDISASIGKISMRVFPFSKTDFTYFKMRYSYSTVYHLPDGPMFIMIGSEINNGWFQSGLMHNLAKENGGCMFYIEQRFLGKNRIFKEQTLETLQYLTSDLAMEDIKVFIVATKEANPFLRSGKVILIGGTIAVWMRQKFPNLVDGVVASSAPVEFTADFKEYYDDVHYNLGDNKCKNIIAKGFKKFKSYVKRGKRSKHVKRDFGFCRKIHHNKRLDKAFAFRSIAQRFAYMATRLSKREIHDECKKIKAIPGNAYSKVSKYIRSITPGCILSYEQVMNKFGSKSCGYYRAHKYQECTELGSYQTSSSNLNPFSDSFPVYLNYQMCEDLFGIRYNRSFVPSEVEHTNKKYGGLNLHVSKVAFVFSQNDPWRLLAPLKDLDHETPVIIFQGNSTFAELYAETLDDNDSVASAKRRIRQYVREWLA